MERIRPIHSNENMLSVTPAPGLKLNSFRLETDDLPDYFLPKIQTRAFSVPFVFKSEAKRDPGFSVKVATKKMVLSDKVGAIIHRH